MINVRNILGTTEEVGIFFSKKKQQSPPNLQGVSDRDRTAI